MDFSPETIRWIIQAMIILILSVAVHEFGHAIVAHKLGDGLPERQGRVTLNPLAHADPIGTLLFPLMGLLYTGGASLGFGWGRPVQINPVSLSRRFTMRRGHMLVALAGPAMNLLFGSLILIVHMVLLRAGVELRPELDRALSHAALLNFVLMFFNLIPLPPLDGSAVLSGVLPDRTARSYERFIEQNSYLALALLLAVFLIPKVQVVFAAPALWLYGHALRLFAVLFGVS